MYKNYFYLLRSINDLAPDLIGSRITEIYTQEKNILFFNTSFHENPKQHLLISVSPQSPYLILRREHHKAKKNVANFFPFLAGQKIIDMSIAENDRIIKISLENASIFFVVKGNKTNIIVIDNEGKNHFFKKPDEETLTITENVYFSGKSHPLIEKDRDEYYELKTIKSKYPMLSSEIVKELEHRIIGKESPNIYYNFKLIVNEIINNDIVVGFNSDLQKVVLIPNSFQTLKIDQHKKEFNNFNAALRYYISIYFSERSKNNYKKELEKYFEKDLNNLAGKLNKLKNRTDEGSKEEKYYKFGNILLANINKIKSGLKSIELESYEDGQIYKIDLDPKINAKKNIDRYFEKAKDEKINFSKSLELFNLTSENYNRVLRQFKFFELADSQEQIIEIYSKIFTKKDKTIKMDSGLKFKYWQYLIEDKYNVYVGRDSKSNDYLSIKFANQQDYWFHARGLPGSHVVLRIENTKDGVPKDIIKKAASIAAFHSKAKTASAAPVSYTFAKFVHKKKGMAPGKVLLQKENTLLVKPEIPKNCVLLNE